MTRLTMLVVAVVTALLGSAALIAASQIDGPAAQDDHERRRPSAFAGIPQEGIYLGDADAPVVLTEFADLQCPYCARFAEETLPVIIDEYVRPGRVRLAFRGLAFIGPESDGALRAALAAGEQGKLWQFVESVYRYQGPENSGWFDDDLARRLAREIDGLDVDRMLAERYSPAVERGLLSAAAAANRAGVQGTPSFYAARDGVLEPVGDGALSAAVLRHALDAPVAR
jgi:protein-disulfide isomerase